MYLLLFFVPGIQIEKDLFFVAPPAFLFVWRAAFQPKCMWINYLLVIQNLALHIGLHVGKKRKFIQVNTIAIIWWGYSLTNLKLKFIFERKAQDL